MPLIEQDAIRAAMKSSLEGYLEDIHNLTDLMFQHQVTIFARLGNNKEGRISERYSKSE